MDNVFQLEGKIALITGSMSGIGLETAKLFINQKIKALILLDIIEDDSILEALKSINNGAQILYRKCDVSDAQDLAEAYNYAWNCFGYIHIAVHAAGIVHEDNSRRVVCVNVGGVIDGNMWLWKKMRKDIGGEGGTIINISSVSGILGEPGMPIYSATKHAVRSFSECLGNSFHYERTGVRVLVVCPGLTKTAMTSNPRGCIDDETDEYLRKRLMNHIFQKAESVAKAILEIYETATSGTVWVAHLDLPAIHHLNGNEKELLEAYFTK